MPKAAERACKSLLNCGVVSRSEMLDGWSETTSPFLLESIIAIFESYGGIRTGAAYGSTT